VLDETMSAQLGLITRAQALCSLTAAQIDHRLSSRAWIVVYPRVYRSAAAPVTFDQAQLAAVLACGDGAALSHRSAAVRHGTSAFTANLIEVSLPGDGRPRLKGVVVHRMHDLLADSIEVVEGVPTTTAARTLIDLGMVVRLPLVARVMEEWLADRRITVESLRHAIDAHRGRGRRGVGVARHALEDRVLGEEAGDSTDEHLVAKVLRAYGAPLPVFHHLVRDHDGRVLAEVDYGYVVEQVGVELLGYNPHTRTRRAFEDFLAKQNLLADHGWVVYGFTPAMIRRRPWAVARQIEDARRERSSLVVSRATGLAS
jgi:hypothetical protein